MNSTIDEKTLRKLIRTGKKALRGNSNDAEHDALYGIVEALETARRNYQINITSQNKERR